jgi:hypothetical protein
MRNRDMPTISSLTLMRLLAAAFLLLLGSREHQRTSTREHSDRRTTERVATANLSAALETIPARIDVDTAQPPLSSADTNLDRRRIRPAPPPTRIQRSFRSCEPTSAEAARPPPLQA